MKIAAITLAVLFFAGSSYAQNGQFDVNLEGFSSFGSVRLNNLSVLGGGAVSDFNYSDVRGSAFWDEHWNTAMFYTSTYSILVGAVKLNLYNNEIWYQDDAGKTWAANPGVVKKIVFYKAKDTSTIVTKFIYLQSIGEGPNHFVQVLNDGQTQLFKLANIKLYKGTADVLNGKEEFGFMNKPDYYLFHNHEIKKLKSLAKDEVLPVVQPTTGDAAWLKQNSNKLKNENDFIAFFNYYNKQH